MAEITPYILLIKTFLQVLLGNTIVVGVAAWVAKIWADKRIESVKGDQARKLEQMKGEQTREIEVLKGEILNIGRQSQAGIDKKMMVFKTHFELEFQSYRELWALCDDAYNVAHQTLGYYQLYPKNLDAELEEKKGSIERYDKCRIALDQVRKLRPFIDKEIANSSSRMVGNCVKITETYKNIYSDMTSSDGFDRKVFINELRKNLDEMNVDYGNIAEVIAGRISRMYITDFSGN